jgi:hypothetical protein
MTQYRYVGDTAGAEGDYEIVGTDGVPAKKGDIVELDEEGFASCSQRYQLEPVSDEAPAEPDVTVVNNEEDKGGGDS